jgi:hypothetical protein
MQPADVSVFKSLKTHVKNEFQKYPESEPTTVYNFAQRLLPAWNKITSVIIKNGFKKSGIFPWKLHGPEYLKI